MNFKANPRHDIFWLALIAAGLCALILGLTGCAAMLPQKRTDSSAVKTAENVATSSAEKFKRVVEGEKAPAPAAPPQVTVTGSSNTVQIASERALPRPLPSPLSTPTSAYREEVTFESAGEVAAGSTESASAFRQISLPLGVTLILCAAGIVAILGAFWAVRRSSAAANEAWKAADEVLANRIRSARSRAQTESDAAEMARLNAERADLEEERGRLAARRKR